MDFIEQAVVKENSLEITRLKIFTALFTHLSKDDEIPITMVEIAKLAGLSRKSVYNHFQNINEIHRELQFLIMQSLLIKAYYKVVSIKENPIKLLYSYLETLHTILSENLDILSYILKSDFYILKARNPIDITISDYLLNKSLISQFISKINPHLSGYEVETRSKMIIEAFLGFATRLTLRSNIIKINKVDINSDFKLFLHSISSLFDTKEIK